MGPPGSGKGGWGLVAERLVGSVVVVFEPPVLEEHFGFVEGVERFEVEELAAEMPVERLDVGILPGCAGFDVGGVDAGEPAPVFESFGDEFRAVVAAEIRRWRPPSDEFFEDRDDPIRVDLAGGDGGDAFAGELVGDVQNLDRSVVGGLVEDEVEGPDVVGMIGDDAVGCPTMPAVPDRPGWDVQALVTPQALHALAITRPAIADQQDVDTPISVARIPASQRVQAIA